MKKNNSTASFSFVGYFLFFFPIAVTVFCSIILHNAISSYFENDFLIILIMLLSIAIFTLIFALIDIYRRKIMVDRPVEQILDATKQLSNGYFKIKLTPLHSYDKYDKYDLIMENFNKMAEELSKSALLKTDFISNVSHELKTPLSIIQNYAKALQDESLNESTRKSYCTSILKASSRLSSLVSNILKLNKLENSSAISSKVKFDISEQLRCSILNFENVFSEKHLHLECIIADGVEIYSSPELLEIVWNNLISNAIKFTDENGKIKITLEVHNNIIVIKVADSGCGISNETGKHIFEKFYQGDTSHSSEGNGLGLAMVKKVIDILGGEISVESEVDIGSTFIVKLKMENL